jgi:glycine/D-amino acid oxidase-like deaminating enzyme
LVTRLALATNAYSLLLPELRRKQIPAFTRIVLSEPLCDRHFAELGWARRQGLEDARNLVHYYRLTADHRLLIGGRDIGLTFGRDFDRDLDERTFAGLEEDARQIFPALADLPSPTAGGGRCQSRCR